MTVMEVAERGERNEITIRNTKLTVTNDSDCVPPSLREREGDGEMKEWHKEEEGNRKKRLLVPTQRWGRKEGGTIVRRRGVEEGSRSDEQRWLSAADAEHTHARTHGDEDG